MATRQDQASGTGYKRNSVKWIAIYLAIGGIAYLIVYLVMSSGGGSGTGGGGY